MTNKKYCFNNPSFESEEPNKEAFRSFAGSIAPPELPTEKKLIKEEKVYKWSIIKNVLVISFAFLCLFTSFSSQANLQSSINKKLGTTSLWVVYTGLVLSCAFLPTFMIKRFKVKWTLTISMLAYSTYMAAQFYPTYYTMIPSALILGFGGANMWSAKCTYLTQVGEIYGGIVGEKSEVIITRFFGIFFLFFQSSQVIGNLISSTVLSIGVEDLERSEEFLSNCGPNFCPSFASNMSTTANSTRSPEEEHKIKIMSSIYLACALISAVIVALFMDSLTKYGENERGHSKDKSTFELLMATFRGLKNPYQLLIIPLTFWSGIEQAFIGADFTAAFVTCGLGVHMVGYVMICYGVCDALCSLGFSPLVKIIGRVPLFIFGACVNIVVLVVMLNWTPNPSDKLVFFVLAACWGIADAIWQTQINAFYGVIFPGSSETAFSNYRLWESFGFIVAYALSADVCIPAKIYLNFAVLGLGMVGYLAIELCEKFKTKK